MGLTFTQEEIRDAENLIGVLNEFGKFHNLSAKQIMLAAKALGWLPNMVKKMKENLFEIVRVVEPEAKEETAATPSAAESSPTS